MKNKDIIALQKAGIGHISSHCLTASQAYKLVKFRGAVRNAFSKIAHLEGELAREAGLEDITKAEQNFHKAVKAGNTAEAEAINAKLERYLEMRNEMLEADVQLDEIKALPYDSWRQLQDENRAVMIGGVATDILSGYVEDILEGILWIAPEE